MPLELEAMRLQATRLSSARVMGPEEDMSTMNDVAPGRTRIGWVGLGVMGSSMCKNLLTAGFSVTLTTRTRSKAAELVAQGARWADTPAEVARASDVLATIVGYPHEVERVLMGEQGVLSGAQPGLIVVDMTTSQPALAQRFFERATAQGVLALDAPVSGGDIGARQGSLSIMVGGDRAAFERLEPFWSVLGDRWVHQGPAGSGQHTKMVNQILIASGMVGVCEALLYGYRAGLDLEQVLQSVASGAAGSWSLSNLAPRMLRGDFAPGFFVDHFLKDMEIALEEARRLGLSLPGLGLAYQLYAAVRAQGHGRSGTQALLLALARLSAIDCTTNGL